MSLKNLHRFTEILVTIYIVAHLFNHTMAWFGVQTHQQIMGQFRSVYRQPVVEAVLICAFLFQAYTGLLLLGKLRKKSDLTAVERLQLYSGATLGFFFILHIGAVVGQRLYYQFDTNFYFAARVLIEYPLKLFFIPYYFLGVVAFGIHVGAAHRRKIIELVAPGVANLHFIIIVFASILIALVILYTFMGGRFSTEIPQQYKVY